MRKEDRFRILRKKKYKLSRRARRINFIVLCLVVFMAFVGIGKSIGEKLTSKTASGEELDKKEQKSKLDKKQIEKQEKEKKKEEDRKESKNTEKGSEKDNKKSKDINEKGNNKVEEQKKVPDDGRKVAYLTFDDGPSVNVTPQILDILDNYNVKATFFVIGSSAEKNPDLVKREHNSGHAIGNHTYSHNYKYIYANVNNFLTDMDKCENVLKNILGNDFHSSASRFPGGSFEKKKQPFKDALDKKGIAHIDWNALNGDAEGHNIPSSNLIQRVVQTTQGKNKVVILMHDAGAKRTTVQALPGIIDYLKKQGYEFQTLDQEAINGL